MANEADTNAAHILVELANRVIFLAKNNAHSSVRSYGRSRMAKSGLLVVNGKMKATRKKAKLSLPEANHTKRRQKTRNIEKCCFMPESQKLLDQYNSEEDEGRESLFGMRGLSRKKGWQNFRLLLSTVDDELGIGYAESKKMTVKRKAKSYESDDFDSKFKLLSENLEKKPDSVKMVAQTVSSRRGSSFIVPTIHTGYSFSVIHLLSSVHMALVAPLLDGVTLALNEDAGEDQRRQRSECEEKDLPCLSTHEIVLRVRSKPGDLRLLETKEPLVDLVRGVLRLFSTKTSPLGAKNWKPLTSYAQSSRKWSWTGPVSVNLPIDEYAKIETASKAWDLPHGTLVKLVDCYANWLNNEREMLKQIDNLPAPPLEFMQPTDAMERFKGLTVQKSINTISPSSEEVRAHFRREEALRYMYPDRAFSYTALDGKKSAVGPLRSGSGYSSTKARDHFMLRESRPPPVTIRCLVTDAAARLPDCVGTRADVCTLLRDSQYIVDKISDFSFAQVVSGALDRLHYEVDPCVKYDKQRCLWVYLHRGREEEDFENHVTVPR